jgi:hypothetical protein
MTRAANEGYDSSDFEDFAAYFQYQQEMFQREDAFRAACEDAQAGEARGTEEVHSFFNPEREALLDDAFYDSDELDPVKWWQENRQPDLDIGKIVAGAVTKDPGNRWLTKKHGDINRIISEVTTLRQTAAATGKPLSDSGIYLQYFREANKPEGKVDATPDQAYKIVNALMGGSRHGQLPF